MDTIQSNFIDPKNRKRLLGLGIGFSAVFGIVYLLADGYHVLKNTSKNRKQRNPAERE